MAFAEVGVGPAVGLVGESRSEREVRLLADIAGVEDVVAPIAAHQKNALSPEASHFGARRSGRRTGRQRAFRWCVMRVPEAMLPRSDATPQRSAEGPPADGMLIAKHDRPMQPIGHFGPWSAHTARRSISVSPTGWRRTRESRRGLRRARYSSFSWAMPVVLSASGNSGAKRSRTERSTASSTRRSMPPWRCRRASSPPDRSLPDQGHSQPDRPQLTALEREQQ